ncbi:glycosyltransferase [Chitinibacter bivalviorum]|uniref:Glycosyltransferase n=1 Tax=Chitinibacter bivalviorum TaxID=2739434 RepID=A0A7H9BHK9_9NEIS|nr:glycosyltransferase [Chitinibacter bivalviorum]QLG88213.1 glycosyltransferase [Chitinibacter bivalviorum]
MKIEVVSFTGDSGLADYAVSLGRALSVLAETTVVTAQSLPSRFDHLGFKVERVFRRSRHYPIDILKFFFGVLNRNPDFILMQGPLKFALLDAFFIRLLNLFGISTAITVHDVLPHYPKFWSRFTFGFYYRSFRHVICHSLAAQQGVSELGISAPVLVVPHGIYDIFNLTGISQAKARELISGLSDNDFVSLFFGHLEPRKGLIPFLECAKSMQSQTHYKFILAGASSVAGHGPEYVQALETARLMPNVIVHDRRIPFEDVENYFSASNVICLPYLEGTTSGVLKIALAFTKPVIATRVGDFPEQVPENAGIVIEADHGISSSLANAIANIEQDYSAYCDAMGAAGADAQWSLIANKIIDFLGLKHA